jgi:pimeloyl-ACP methyl ester carboxylesterase
MATSTARAHPVIFLPGILMPAALRYERLVAALGRDVRAVVKDLEIYLGPSVPPPGYRLETEVEGIARAADEAGFDRFHIYGHSAGGACALAFVAEHPERVLTLALDEPATDFSLEDLDEIREVHLPLLELPHDELMPAFTRTLLPKGVEPPPPSQDPPPWLADRLPGVAAFIRAMCEAEVEFERFERFDRPVSYSYGSLSNPTWERKAKRLAGVFPNITLERYEGLSHLNTSHVAEPERVATALRALWTSS